MTIGPVQLIVLGFYDAQAHGAIADELKRLRDSDMVRVVDALVVAKDADGEMAALETSQLTDDESVEYGALVGPSSGSARAASRVWKQALKRAPRRPQRMVSGSSLTRSRGMSWLRSRMGLPRP